MRVGGKQAVAGEPGDRIYKVEGRDKIRGKGGGNNRANVREFMWAKLQV